MPDRDALDAALKAYKEAILTMARGSANNESEQRTLELPVEIAHDAVRKAAGEMGEVSVTDEMVNRFLTWPLPASVYADPCASMQDYPYRTGTNLLTAIEARAMLEHVLHNAVRKAAREMGEEFTVDRVYGQAVIHLGADGQFFDKGDRVRVVKVGTTEDSHGSVCYWHSRDGEPIENCEKLYTDCGHRYDNGVCKFCPFCGKKVGE